VDSDVYVKILRHTPYVSRGVAKSTCNRSTRDWSERDGRLRGRMKAPVKKMRKAIRTGLKIDEHPSVVRRVVRVRSTM